MYDALVQQNIEVLKQRYSDNKEVFEKLCALSYLLKKKIIPVDLVVLFSNDMEIIEENIKSLA